MPSKNDLRTDLRKHAQMVSIRKREENGVSLSKFYILYGASKNFGWPHTALSNPSILPLNTSLDNTSHYQYAKLVPNTLTNCLSLFLNLDLSSGQV